MGVRGALLALLLLAPLIVPAPAQALCIPASLTATAVDFGLYDPGAAGAAQSQGTIKFTCTLSVLTSATISLSRGSGSYAQRTMTGSSGTLNYNLYLDPAHSMVWGDGTAGTFTADFSSILALGAITYTVYGLAGPGQYPAPGTYQDTIIVTVTF